MITKIGVGVLIIDEYDYILLGKRKGSHGENEWGTPGGKVEYLEDIYSTARREILEEAGPDLKYGDLKIVTVSNLVKYHPKHFIDFGLVTKYLGGKPMVMEPDKVAEWSWHHIDNLPNPLFGLIAHYVEEYKNGSQIKMITM